MGRAGSASHRFRRAVTTIFNRMVSTGGILNMKQRFIIDILYKQNSTWQGTVKWVNQGKSQNFRSALELIRLLDSTMDDNTLPDWNDDKDTD